MKNWLVFIFGLALLSASILYFKPYEATVETVNAQPAVAGAVIEKVVESPVLAKINDSRALNGLTRLKSDPTLDTIARKRATDMIVQGKYSHTMADGKFYDSLLEKVGITSGFSCENLDLIVDESGLGAINDWLASSAGHKECMLSAKTEYIGLSVLPFDHVESNGSSQMYYVVVAISSQFTL